MAGLELEEHVRLECTFNWRGREILRWQGEKCGLLRSKTESLTALIVMKLEEEGQYQEMVERKKKEKDLWASWEAKERNQFNWML